MKKCPFCGADIEENARFCLYCMQSLTGKEQIISHQKKKPQYLTIIAAIGLSLVALAVVWFSIQTALRNRTPSDVLPATETAHTPAAAVKENYIDSSCTKTGSYDEVVYCSVCSEEIGRTKKTVDKKPHDHNQKITTNEYLKTGATETSAALYYYSCVCGEKGTSTFTVGSALEHTHDFSRRDIALRYQKSPDTCSSPAVYYHSCTCGEKGTTTFTYGAVIPHKYNQKVATSEYLKTGATETSAAVYYYSCVCGEKGTSTFTVGSALEHTHSFDQKNTSLTYRKSIATCTEAAVYYYSCSCGEKGIQTFEYGLPDEHDWDSNGFCSACGIEEGGLTFIKTGDSYAVSGYGGIRDSVSIPAVYNGLPITSISTGAFMQCTDLTSIVIPNSVTIIDELAFEGCLGLASITFDKNSQLTIIGDFAFAGCTSLTSITLPSSLTSINRYAFYNCTSLTSITVENGNIKYHSSGNCLIETASKTLVVGCKNSVIPTDGSVASIGEYAFAACNSPTSVTIPNSVTSIGYGAFDGCTNLTSITVEKGNNNYHVSGNCLIETKSKTLIKGFHNSVIPTDGSVTSIESDAFSGCTSLTSISIPDSVTSIGYCAFSYCSKLQTINFGGTYTQWYSMSKGAYWNYKTPTITVYCTDGNITLTN